MVVRVDHTTPVRKGNNTATAWAALQRALTAREPACRDDPRFLADGRDRGQTHHRTLRDICASCGVLTELTLSL